MTISNEEYEHFIVKCIAQYLGVCLTTAKLYYQVIRNPTKLESLKNEYSEVISRLDELKSLRLIAEWKNARSGSEAIITAMDPVYSLQAIILQEAWRRDSSLHDIHDIEVLSEDDSLRKRYELLKQLIPIIERIYSKHTPYEGEDAYMIRGGNEIAAAIALEISNAKNEVKAMVCPPQLMGEVVWESITSCMNRGIRYARLTEFEEIARHGFEISKREISNRQEILLILQDGYLPERFYVIDDFTTIFFERNRRTGRYKKEIHIFKNEGVAERFIEVFRSVAD